MLIIRGRLTAYDNGALLYPSVGASGLRTKQKFFIVLNSNGGFGPKTVFKIPVVSIVHFHTRLTSNDLYHNFISHVLHVEPRASVAPVQFFSVTFRLFAACTYNSGCTPSSCHTGQANRTYYYYVLKNDEMYVCIVFEHRKKNKRGRNSVFYVASACPGVRVMISLFPNVLTEIKFVFSRLLKKTPENNAPINARTAGGEIFSRFLL